MIVDFREPLYSYDTFVSDAKSLANQYPNIIKCVTIGVSHDNRDIILLKLGIGQKHIISCSGVHARETVNPIVIMKIIEYYAELYTNYKEQKDYLFRLLTNTKQHLVAEYEQMLYGTCIHELLHTFTILFVPLLNPDGYMISLEGFGAIRNDGLRKKCLEFNIPSTEWKMNARGVDINRNFKSKLWRQKSAQDTPNSENETKALISVFHNYPSKGFLDFHSRGKEIYYYRSLMSDYYNDKQLEIAQRLKEITGYELVAPEEEIDIGDSGGNTVHYYSEHFRKPALTIETVEEIASFPLDHGYRTATFEEIKYVVFGFGSLII
jgi:g-D-glutamyl-meso-diaminopimelate peptidase